VAVPPGKISTGGRKAGFSRTEVAESVFLLPVAQVVDGPISRLQVGKPIAKGWEVTSQTPLLTPSTAGSELCSKRLKSSRLCQLRWVDGGRQLQNFHLHQSFPETVGDTFSGSINGGQAVSAMRSSLTGVHELGRYDLSGGSLDEFSPGTEFHWRIQGADVLIIRQNTARRAAGIAQFRL